MNLDGYVTVDRLENADRNAIPGPGPQAASASHVMANAYRQKKAITDCPFDLARAVPPGKYGVRPHRRCFTTRISDKTGDLAVDD
jgi:hypothetical protein